MKIPNNYLNILDLNIKGSYALGPGLRYCIWVQGCPFNCAGCATPEGIPIVPNKMMPVREIVQSILRNEQITGITISGGEPFLQASKLIIMLQEVLEKRPQLNTIIYTGFKKEQLDWPEAIELLKQVDVLIDGLYIKVKDDSKGLRGSSNQEVHFLTERLISHKSQFESALRKVDLFINEQSAIFVGIPNEQIISLIL